jgi:hypothetical protein
MKKSSEHNLSLEKKNDHELKKTMENKIWGQINSLFK